MAARTVLAVLLVILTIQPLAAQTPLPEVIARNLAENVLGEGTVRSVAVSADGRRVVIAWTTVLYRSTSTVERNREQMQGEAQLATGSIMGRMWPDVIDFTMVLGVKIMATGRRTKDGGFTMQFAPELGG